MTCKSNYRLLTSTTIKKEVVKAQDSFSDLPNSSSGVSSSIKGISSFSDSVAHACHLSNTSGIVTNGTICIYCQPSGNGTQHSKGSYSNTIHSSKRETNKNAGCDSKDRNDDRFVSQCKPKNNISGSSSSAGISNILNRAAGFCKLSVKLTVIRGAGVVTRNKSRTKAYLYALLV